MEIRKNQEFTKGRLEGMVAFAVRSIEVSAISGKRYAAGARGAPEIPNSDPNCSKIFCGNQKRAPKQSRIAAVNFLRISGVTGNMRPTYALQGRQREFQMAVRR